MVYLQTSGDLAKCHCDHSNHTMNIPFHSWPYYIALRHNLVLARISTIWNNKIISITFSLKCYHKVRKERTWYIIYNICTEHAKKEQTISADSLWELLKNYHHSTVKKLFKCQAKKNLFQILYKADLFKCQWLHKADLFERQHLIQLLMWHFLF